jgi:hypothetical protein
VRRVSTRSIYNFDTTDPLLKAIIKAISQVRFANGKCPTIVRQFLIDQLKYNDNTANSVRLPLQHLSDMLTVLSIRMHSIFAP